MGNENQGEPVGPRGLPGPGTGLEERDIQRVVDSNGVGWQRITLTHTPTGVSVTVRRDSQPWPKAAHKAADEAHRRLEEAVKAAQRPGEPLGEPVPDPNPNSPGAGPVSKEGEA